MYTRTGKDAVKWELCKLVVCHPNPPSELPCREESFTPDLLSSIRFIIQTFNQHVFDPVFCSFAPTFFVTHSQRKWNDPICSPRYESNCATSSSQPLNESQCTQLVLVTEEEKSQNSEWSISCVGLAKSVSSRTTWRREQRLVILVLCSSNSVCYDCSRGVNLAK